MKLIYKYRLFAQPLRYDIPHGAQFLCVQTQREQPQMWFLVDENEKRFETRHFVGIATGEKFDVLDEAGRKGEYRGTFQLGGGSLVFHLFEYV